MPIVTLKDLYVADLQDLFDAEQQILHALPRMAAAATSSALRDAFDLHQQETRIHAERLELLMRKLAAGTGGPCEAIRGILAEARRRIHECERGDVLDAALVGAAQRIEHYEIAAYGCARTYARTLDDDDAAKLLQQTLDEEGAADARLTAIAEGGINQAAGDDLASDAERQRERLRYVPASHLHEFRYREFRVRNAQDEDLGSLDGLILDARSDQPRYFVIDSGGWFVGHRYVVPIDALQPDEASSALRTTLDRQSIEAYPPFNPEAYLSPETPASAGSAESDTAYRPPTWLMTGVWMTEASGFASVAPRAESDFDPAAPRDVTDERPENELMIARGEPEERGESARELPEPRNTPHPER